MKRYLSVLFVFVLLLSMLAGCGAKEEAAVSSPGAAPMATEAAMEEVLYDEASSETGSGTTLPENQKLIRTVHMDAQTLSMNPLMAWLDSRVAELGGYYEQKSVRRSGSRDDGSYYQFADLMIRIPAENLDQFVSQIGEEANVISKSETTENVTLTYVSTQSRVLALETEQQRLLELLENAETMKDLLTIEERLTEVRWQLENYASQLRVLDNQVNYSTIYLNIREVDEPTVMTERTVWQKIGDGFSENAIDLWTGMVNIFVWLLSSLPYLIPIGVVAILGWKFGKKMKNKKAKKSQPEEK